MKLVERIWISSNKKTKHLTRLVYDLAHFRNLVLIFIHEYHKKTEEWLISESLLYSLIADNTNNRTLRNNEKMKKIEEVKANLDDELSVWIDLIREQKARIDNNYLVQQILRQIKKDFRSYSGSLKEYYKNPEKFDERPNPPKPRKLKNLHHFTVEFNANVLRQEGRKLKLRLRVKSDKWMTIKLSSDYKISSVRLCYFLGEFYVDVVREVEVPIATTLGNYKAGIDLNLDNLIVLTSTNPQLRSIIITGGEIKAFNQWFNKLKSKLQSEHDKVKNEIEELQSNSKEIPEELVKREKELRWKIRQLYIHRKRWLDNHFHRLTKYLAVFLYCTGHDEVIIGNGALSSKKNCKLSSKTAEKFVQIPYRSLIAKLKYKCEALGIKVKEVSEEYTSQISCVTGERGKRIKRGLFKDLVLSKVFNADCNASFNILKKGAKLPELTKLFDLKTLFVKLCNPVKIRFMKFVEFVQRVIPESSGWRIGGSTAPKGAGSNPVAFVQVFQSTLFDNKRIQCYATG